MSFIQKQTIPISFQGGLQSKTDALQIQPPGLLEVQNACFDKIGQLNKRPGYDLLSQNVINGNTIFSSAAIDSFAGELNLFDNQNIYTYIEANKNWQTRGTAISVINSNNQIIRNANQQLNPDSATSNGITVFAWEDSRGGIRYSVLDQATSAYIISDKILNSNGSKPKCIVYNNLLYIIYNDGFNNLFFQVINPTNPSQIGIPINITADLLQTTGVFDACIFNVELNLPLFLPNGPYLDIAWIGTDGYSNPLGRIEHFIIGPSATYGPYNLLPAPISVPSSACLSVVGVSFNQLWFSWSDGIQVNSFCVNLSNSTISQVVVDTLSCNLITGIESSTSPGALQIVYQANDGYNVSNTFIKIAILTNINPSAAQPIVITPIGTQLSVGIASKPFVNGQNIYINTVFQSPLQSTYFTHLLSNPIFTIIGKINGQVSGGLRTNGMVPEIYQVAPSNFQWSNLVKGQFISEDNTSFSLLGVNATTISFTDIDKFNSATFTNNLLIVGGILQSYDGTSVVEQNFHLFPEGITFSNLLNSGALSAGQYQYQVVYAWTDKFGQIQYSGPSPILTVTAQVNDAILLNIPTLRLTAKTNVTIKIYRTQVNQTVFQEVTSEIAPLFNATNIDSVIFLDTVADINIAGNQTIYTTGGILPNSAPPSSSLISLYSTNRVMLSGLEDSNLIWFSKNKANATNFNTIPVEFSADLTLAVSQTGGAITALGLLDESLIIFKKSAIFVLTGDGPNDAGGGNQFSDPQLMTQTVGCNNPNSIILGPDGIYFQTPDKGIWMIPRGLGSPTYVGAGIDDLAKQYLVSSAVLDPNNNHIIFTTTNGPALVYDYIISQWSTWTNHNAIDAITFQNKFTFVKSNGQVFQQDLSIFSDGYSSSDGYQGIPINMEIITPWLSFGGLQGYQRVFRGFLLGQFRGQHQLKVSVGYDFNPAFTQSCIFNSSKIAGSNVWGADGTWGSSTPWGGTWQPYELQINFATQKCSSIRLKITEIQSSPYNEGLTLNHLNFEVGVLGDGVRLPLSNKAGTQSNQ